MSRSILMLDANEDIDVSIDINGPKAGQTADEGGFVRSTHPNTFGHP